MPVSATTLNPRQARSQLGNAIQRRDPAEVVADRRRDLAEANIAAAIARALAAAPPLTDEQADRIAALLRGADTIEAHSVIEDLDVGA